MSAQDIVTREVRALEELDLEGLRTVWRKMYGDPPSLRSKNLLRHMLAWRMQAARLGGIDTEIRQALKRSKPTRKLADSISVGTKLSREWQGVRYDVIRTEMGFAFDNRTFKSLSHVARAITNVRWNGPRFFGLRESAK